MTSAEKQQRRLLKQQAKQQRKAAKQQAKLARQQGSMAQPQMLMPQPYVGPTTPPGIVVPPMVLPAMGAPTSFPATPGICGTPCGPVLGWVSAALTEMANAQRWCISLDGNSEIIPDDLYPLFSAHANIASLQSAARIALGGYGAKKFGIAKAADPVVDLTATPAATPTFALRIRLTAAVTSFGFGTYEFQIFNGATVQSVLHVHAPRIPMDIIVLSAQPIAGSLMSVVQNPTPSVKMLVADNSALNPGDVLVVETLTLRDLGFPPNAALMGGIA